MESKFKLFHKGKEYKTQNYEIPSQLYLHTSLGYNYL